ncbi:MAG: hypothetical protein AB2708_10220, partial [Candidatus Thiodiazotropha taylori]
KVKINYCAPRELLSLPGVGRNLSDAILDLRDSKGNLCLEDLAQVRYLNVTPELIAMIDFEPYDANPLPSSEQDPTMPMISRVDQAIASSNLRGPPAQYTNSVSFASTTEGRIPTDFRDSSYTMGQSLQTNVPPQGFMPGSHDRGSSNYNVPTGEPSYQSRYSQHLVESFTIELYV